MQTSARGEPKMKTYEAHYVANAKLGRDGLLDASEWEKANVETRFSFPWEDRAAPRTEFRAVRRAGVVFRFSRR